MEVGPLAELFGLLIGLYLLECLRWVGPGSIAVRSLLPGFWQVSRAWRGGVSWRRALTWAAPWPPFGALWIADLLPVLLTPDGIVAGTSVDAWTWPGVDAVHVPWSAARRITFNDRELRIDGRWVATVGTRRLAGSLASVIAAASSAPASRRRAVLLDFLAQRFDVTELLSRRARWRRAGWPLLILSHLLLGSVFGGLSLVLWTSAAAFWREAIAVAVLTWMWTVACLIWTRAKLLPADARPPWSERLVTLLSPLSLARSADDVRVELLGDLDPFAVAAAHLRGARLEAFVRRALAEVQWPLEPPDGRSPSPHVQDAARWMRDRTFEQMVRAARKLGLHPLALLAHERRIPDPGSVAWCPRCLTQYTEARATCASCLGVGLIPAANR